MPANSMIASVNPCQLVAAGVRDVQRPGDARVDRRQDAGGQIGGEGRRQQLVGHDLQLALLARASDHPRDEVAALRRAPVQPVQPRGADDQQSPGRTQAPRARRRASRSRRCCAGGEVAARRRASTPLPSNT